MRSVPIVERKMGTWRGSHFKEVVHALVQVLLLQGDPDRYMRICQQSITFDPTGSGRIVLLMNDGARHGPCPGLGKEAADDSRVSSHPVGL